MTTVAPKRPSWLAFSLSLLPLWLVASAGLAIWFGLKKEKQATLQEARRFSQGMSETMIADDLQKLVRIIGERHAESDTAAKNLTRAASMIEGILGPANTGYAIDRIPGPVEWPILRATLRAKDPGRADLWVLTTYDSAPGSPGAEANASGVAATIAAAQALANDTLPQTIHFVFLPHFNDPDAPILPTLNIVKNLLSRESKVLCVEAMGAEDNLWVSSRDTTHPALNAVASLGSVRGAEVVCLGEASDLSTALFQMGISAARVSTRPILPASEPDSPMPTASHVAASAGRLVELIRRCASAPPPR